MPTGDDTQLSTLLIDFLGGDMASGADLVQRVDVRLRNRIRRSAPPDFEMRGLVSDVVSRTWELLLRKPSGSYDPARGRALAYIFTVARTAIRDVRDENARIVSHARDYVAADSPASPAGQRGRRSGECEEQVDQGTFDLADSTIDLLAAMASLPPTIELAARMIAFSDVTMVAASEAIGESRFLVKRRLVQWAERGALTAA